MHAALTVRVGAFKNSAKINLMSSIFFVFSQVDFQDIIDFSQKAVQNSRILMKFPGDVSAVFTEKTKMI